jgi:lipopolysaccharide/colanic/teichoic acid biosynthesis glycosyltransferase
MRIDTKRLFDVAGAAGGLLFFAPVMTVISVAILLDDGGPVVFCQERLGERRAPFTIFKFRSMRDGRTTRVGRVLRSTGLDELPQLINVLRGDMSAVGPRPLEAADVTRWGWHTPRYDFRWDVRPGLTGLGQMQGSGSPRDRIVLDRLYIAHRSLLLDVRLVALSFAVNVLGKRRVRELLRGSRRSIQM